MSDPALETFERLFGPEFGHGKPFDLDKLGNVLRALDAPNANLPPVFHVAGTNGKGSTIAFMRAIAEAAGLKVHAFTKPHLFKLNERFVVAGSPATDDALISIAERIALIDSSISQFDAQTAAALTLFDETWSDLVLLETGMGGRNDSTNVIRWPAASVVTPIGLDHGDALGDTVTEIAAHKAGIFKRNSPAIIARQSAEVSAVLETEAARVGAPLFRAGVEWDAYVSHGRLVVQTERRALDLPMPALQGQHQIDNAGLACATFLAPTRFTIADEPFAQGVANARWPARLQPLTRGALSAPVRAIGGEVWVDGGHNTQALASLANWAITSSQKVRRAPLAVIFNARPRKEWSVAIKPLAQMCERFIAVPMEGGVDPAQIAAHAASEGATSTVAPSLAAAMQIAAQLPAPRVLICGSFVLAAEALAAESA